MRLIFISALMSFAVDQLSKWWVVHVMGLINKQSIDVYPPFLNFRMGWNTGINFGLFGGSAESGRWILIGVALVIICFVLIWVWRDKPGKIGLISAGVLVGGALGNVVDRILYGAVADFLNMSCCGIQNPFTFNIADVAIFIGAFGLILFSSPKKGKKGA